MNNELITVSKSLAPATTVEQTGEHNVYVGHTNEITQNVLVFQTGFITPPNGTIQPAYKRVTREYYNLFVVGSELSVNEQIILSPERTLSPYWTSEDVRSEYAALSEDAIERIKTFPSLFMAETRNYRAQAEDDEQVFFGFVNDIRVQGNGIRIRWEMKWPIPMRQIAAVGFDLGMLSMNCAITEMNHTHWAIKHVDLYDELKKANISIMGM